MVESFIKPLSFEPLMKESRSSMSIMQLFIGLLQFNTIEKKIYSSIKMFERKTRNHKLSKCEFFLCLGSFLYYMAIVFPGVTHILLGFLC
jgi:hypothetical protein